jgi:hypothetical protein
MQKAQWKQSKLNEAGVVVNAAGLDWWKGMRLLIG